MTRAGCLSRTHRQGGGRDRVRRAACLQDYAFPGIYPGIARSMIFKSSLAIDALSDIGDAINGRRHVVLAAGSLVTSGDRTEVPIRRLHCRQPPQGWAYGNIYWWAFGGPCAHHPHL
jgi:hypothetical protein